jgi:hypothetical protein
VRVGRGWRLRPRPAAGRPRARDCGRRCRAPRRSPRASTSPRASPGHCGPRP